MKKFFNPWILLISLFLLVFAVIAHIMYGSSQTSRLHFLAQCYYVPTYLPEVFWVSNMQHERFSGHRTFRVDKNYTGIWRVWTTNGSYSEQEFIQGKMNGKFIIWDEKKEKIYEARFKNDDLLYRAEYKNGKLNGSVRQDYDSGRKHFLIFYLNGVQHGKEEWHYENGEREKDFNYNHGKKEGEFIERYENGNKKSEKIYKDDKLISSDEWNQDGSSKENENQKQ
jgi:antitoxin component YwqK of YwqJK toxin-antitoxin module